ncbi:MAG: NAD-dependent epimerase/dehydratase family protein [Pedobacter sp.]|nr:MAG: NAD-dependent epimerase/dehydratase family protein [Pedobacter sp.]
MAKVLVIGAGGQLGQCIKKIVFQREIDEVAFPEEGAANILNITDLSKLFSQENPNYVINCAAYTAVDKAEDEADIAKAVNETGAKNLAELCKQYNATLIHISTDFVFEGNEIKLLKEDDVANPISVYGVTKLDGELAIIKELDKHVIIRTSWLYSEFANNFVKTMLKLGADLANTIFDIIQNTEKKYGVYHFSNEGVTSWYDFAKAIFDYSGTEVKVNPIPTSAYPTKAKRPHFSVMDKSKIKADYNIQVPYWLNSLKACIDALKLMN